MLGQQRRMTTGASLERRLQEAALEGRTAWKELTACGERIVQARKKYDSLFLEAAMSAYYRVRGVTVPRQEFKNAADKARRVYNAVVLPASICERDINMLQDEACRKEVEHLDLYSCFAEEQLCTIGLRMAVHEKTTPAQAFSLATYLKEENYLSYLDKEALSSWLRVCAHPTSKNVPECSKIFREKTLEEIWIPAIKDACERLLHSSPQKVYLRGGTYSLFLARNALSASEVEKLWGQLREENFHIGDENRLGQCTYGNVTTLYGDRLLKEYEDAIHYKLSLQERLPLQKLLLQDFIIPQLKSVAKEDCPELFRERVFCTKQPIMNFLTFAKKEQDYTTLKVIAEIMAQIATFQDKFDEARIYELAQRVATHFGKEKTSRTIVQKSIKEIQERLEEEYCYALGIPKEEVARLKS